MKKFSLILACVALAGLSATACNESVHWLECSPDQNGMKLCSGGKIYVCSYNDNNGTQEDGYYLSETGEACASEDGTVIRACEPGSFRCDNNVLIGCSASGEWDITNAEDCQSNVCDPVAGQCKESAPVDDKCEENAARCDDGKYQVCTSGEWTTDDKCVSCKEDKDESGKDIAVCVNPACVKGETKCDDDGKLVTCDESGEWGTPAACDADKAEICKLVKKMDGEGDDAKEIEVAACVSTNCYNDAGELVAENGKKLCVNDEAGETPKHAVMLCNEGVMEETLCDEAKHEVCSTLDEEYGCYARVESLIGEPCSCTDEQACGWSYGQSDILGLLLNGNNHLQHLKAAIAADTKLDVPNFFPGVANITTEDNKAQTLKTNLETVNPALDVACYRTATIGLTTLMTKEAMAEVIDKTVDEYKLSIAAKLLKSENRPDGFENLTNVDFNELYAALTDEQKEELDTFARDYFKKYIGFELDALVDMIKLVAPNILSDIHFVSDKGYLAAGAVKSTVDAKGAIGYRLFNNKADDPASLNSLFAKQTAGDVDAAIASKACPEGSTFLYYVIDQTTLPILDTIGDASSKMAMCLKSCNSDADCNDGSTCMNMAKSNVDETGEVIEEDKREMVRVCFDSTSVSDLTTMINNANIKPIEKTPTTPEPTPDPAEPTAI